MNQQTGRARIDRVARFLPSKQIRSQKSEHHSLFRHFSINHCQWRVGRDKGFIFDARTAQTRPSVK